MCVQPLDPPIAIQGITIPIALMFFRVSQGIALYPPSRGIAAQAALRRVSRYRGVSLRYDASRCDYTFNSQNIYCVTNVCVIGPEKK